MQTPIEPSELSFTDITLAKDLPKALVDAIAKNDKIVVSDLLRNGAPITLKLVGQVTTNGIEVNEKYNNHSFGFAFSDEKQLGAFLELYKLFDGLGLESDWKVVDMVRQQRIYLKMKIKDGQYVAKTNIKVNAKSPRDAAIVRYQKVEVQVDLKAYFSLDPSKSCGYYFDIFNIIFDVSK